jgi:hypothetical protein
MTNAIAQHRRPSCPHCGGPLWLAGDVVDTGRFKTWVDRWACDTHGDVDLVDDDRDDRQRGQTRSSAITANSA